MIWSPNPLPPEVVNLVAEFAREAINSSDLTTLHAHCDAFTREIGFRYFAIVDHRASGGNQLLCIDNYPSEWAHEFYKRGYDKVDPVHQTCRRAPFAFEWSEVRRYLNPNSDQIGVLEQGIKAGLGLGYTVPIRQPGLRMASCSFATKPGAKFPDQTLLAAQWAAGVAFEAAKRLTGSEFLAPGRLTPRQRECVALMALGKSDWEISAITGLSEDTITKYLNAARARYGVSRRTQLALAALADGEIDPDEIISWIS